MINGKYFCESDLEMLDKEALAVRILLLIFMPRLMLSLQIEECCEEKRGRETRGISMIYSDGNMIVGIIVGSDQCGDQTIGFAHPQPFSIRVTNNNTVGLIGEINVIDKAGSGPVHQSRGW